PVGLLIDRRDTLYVADAGNNRVPHFLESGTVANAATIQANVPIAQGALAAIFGSAIAADSATAGGMPLPRALADPELVVNDEPAPLLYAGPGQVNFQVPSQAQVGTAQIAVRIAATKELLAGGTIVVASVTPALYTVNAAGQALAVNQDGTLN